MDLNGNSFEEFFWRECPDLISIDGPISDYFLFLDFQFDLFDKLDICFDNSTGTQFPEIYRDIFDNEIDNLESQKYYFRKFVFKNLLLKFFRFIRPVIFHRVSFGELFIVELLLKPTDKTIIKIKNYRGGPYTKDEYFVVLKSQKEQAKLFLTLKHEDFVVFIPDFPIKEIKIKKSVATQCEWD
ncbi:unnamed protein product [Brachionus calyciflorus]|uniref:Uncharacterized protein n=1 Tax=Brachionus calyciflorus TaxID=104777 RepID=A0A814NJE4_9BILA|nr:unnamed protein product [Brachionus calyciflorus]